MFYKTLSSESWVRISYITLVISTLGPCVVAKHWIYELCHKKNLSSG